LTRELAADAGELRSRSTKVQITMPQPVERDLEESRKRLCDWLGKKLPAADGLRISELTGPSETGFSSDTLLFTAEYRAAKTSWCASDPPASPSFRSTTSPSSTA
jgi:hypothetical protein